MDLETVAFSKQRRERSYCMVPFILNVRTGKFIETKYSAGEKVHLAFSIQWF